MNGTPSSAPPLGEWAVEAYGRPGVEDACLVLQDRHGLDVVAVLWCTWVGAHLGTLDADPLTRIVGDGHRWRIEVVEALRRVRRLLKEPAEVGWVLGLEGDAQAAAFDRLRRRVAEAELVAEMFQLDQLEARTMALAATPAITGSAGPDAIRVNVARLADTQYRHVDPACHAAIDVYLDRVASTGDRPT